MIGVGNGVGGARHRGAAVLTDGTRTLINGHVCGYVRPWPCGHALRGYARIRMSESGFKCSVHVSSVSMTMYDDSKWKDTYNMISRPRL
jgi:hypothetical protein